MKWTRGGSDKIWINNERERFSAPLESSNYLFSRFFRFRILFLRHWADFGRIILSFFGYFRKKVHFVAPFAVSPFVVLPSTCFARNSRQYCVIRQLSQSGLRAVQQ